MSTVGSYHSRLIHPNAPHSVDLPRMAVRNMRSNLSEAAITRPSRLPHEPFLTKEGALKQRKLILLLEVEYVLLHRTHVHPHLLNDRHKGIAFPEEIHSTRNSHGAINIIVLRPWVRQFLLLLSHSFQLALIFTNPSTSTIAQATEKHLSFVDRVSELLDPQGTIFGHRCFPSIFDIKKQSINREFTMALTIPEGTGQSTKSEEKWNEDSVFPIRPFFYHFERHEEHFEVKDLYLSKVQKLLEEIHCKFFADFEVTQQVPNLRDSLVKSPFEGFLNFPNPSDKKLSFGCSSGYSTDNEAETESALNYRHFKADQLMNSPRCMTCTFMESNERQSTSSCELSHNHLFDGPHPSEINPHKKNESGQLVLQEEVILRDYIKEYESILREQDLLRHSWLQLKDINDQLNVTNDQFHDNIPFPSIPRTLSRWNYLVARKDVLLRKIFRNPFLEVELPTNTDSTKVNEATTNVFNNSHETEHEVKSDEISDKSYEIISEEELHELWLLKTIDLYPHSRRCRRWFKWIR